MPAKLYAHPLTAYCQKVLIALYENDAPFEFRMLAPGDERAAS
jgi:glutathione S-transferase